MFLIIGGNKLRIIAEIFQQKKKAIVKYLSNREGIKK